MTEKPRTRRYSPTEKSEAVALAVVLGNQTEAAEELGIPQQTISEWSRRADSADIKLYIQAKGLEAAASVAERLPVVAAKLLAKVEAVLDDPDVKWNGTQLQATQIALSVAGDFVKKWTDPNQGRFGTHGGGPVIEPLEGDVAKALEQTRTQG